jgi:hypothetical protein
MANIKACKTTHHTGMGRDQARLLTVNARPGILGWIVLFLSF